MARNRITVKTQTDRRRAAHWCLKAPVGWGIEFIEPSRTDAQNRKMWALLTKLSRVEWRGGFYSKEDWGQYHLNALRRGRWMPDEEGGFVPLGHSMRDLSIKDASDMIEQILAFAARHGFDLGEDKKEAA